MQGVKKKENRMNFMAEISYLEIVYTSMKMRKIDIAKKFKKLTEWMLCKKKRKTAFTQY